MNDIANCAVDDGLFKAATGHALFETDVEFRARCGICDEPHFGFGFAMHLFGEMCGGMDLDGEVVSGIQDLD